MHKLRDYPTRGFDNPRVTMALHQAMSAPLPDGFYLTGSVAGYFQTHGNGKPVDVAPLGAAHIAQYQTPGLFTEDPWFPGDRDTVHLRVYSDLIHTWPVLAVRLRYIPGLYRALKQRFLKYIKVQEDWSLFTAIVRIGPPIIEVLREENI